MRGWITVSFNDVTFAKPCFEFQRAESTIDFDVEIILTVSQVIFNFTFEILTFCDNHIAGLLLMVFVLIFTSLGISHVLQHRVLMWGIIGAIFMRIGFIIAGISLLESFHWMIYILGAVLIFTSIRMITKKEKERLEVEKSFSVRFLKKFIPIDISENHTKFLVKKQGKRYATILLVALFSVEMTDLAFALDSIPAVLAITSDTFIVITSNIFAILGLRSLYFVIGRGIENLVYLKYGLTILLGFIGVKMLISEIYKIDIIHSLIVILAVLGLTIGFSLLRKKKHT